MAVYHKFGPADIVHYNLNTSPKVILASGTAGWRGSVGTSGSISLYGGIRSRETTGTDLTIQPTYNLDTYTIDGKVQISASYPFTGSVSYVQVVNRAVDKNTEQHDSFWGDEHFRPILNLYDYYEKVSVDYTTASYDYYMLYSEPSTQNIVTFGDGPDFSTMTASYTIEAMIKPLSISGSNNDYTIMAMTVNSTMMKWRFYITGSNGRLGFFNNDDDATINLTSSFSVTRDRWQHVAFRVSNNTGSFTIDMVDAGVRSTSSLTLPVPEITESLRLFSLGDTVQTFHGYMFDAKVWAYNRTFSEMSSSFDRTLVLSGSDSRLLVYARLNDGPKSILHGRAAGSGAFNYAPDGSSLHGRLQNFNSSQRPIWTPNDNADFITQKKLIPSSQATINEFRVVHIPSLYYGRAIATGSVRLECNSFLSQSIQRILVDDGRGGLYLSGSATSASFPADKENYRGVHWNKVGNVFYSEGLIVIRDPALLNFGEVNPSSQMPNDLLRVSFAGQQRVPTKVFMCRINGAATNASNNSSFTTFDSGSNKLRVIRDNPTTYVTAVGLYNKERKLVGIAKLAQPVRNRERDKINVRLKLDF